MEKALVTEKLLTLALSLAGITVAAVYMVVFPRRLGGKVELSKAKYSQIMAVATGAMALLSVVIWWWFR